MIQIKLNWESRLYNDYNLDSIAVYNKKIYITCKSKNTILVLNLKGGFIRFIGNNLFNRPNGILILDNFMFITERDSHRIHLYDLDKNVSIGVYGSNILKYPYGIKGFKIKGIYNIYVTDNKLKKVFNFNFKIINNKFYFKFIKSFGNNLKKLECLCVDKNYNRILISDEEEKNIQIYNLNGQYLKTIGNKMFLGDPEGMDLYKINEEEGIYITTDQTRNNNRFHLWDRKTLQYKETIYNKYVTNTDGICISEDKKELYVINNDLSVCSLELIEKKNNKILLLFPILLILRYLF